MARGFATNQQINGTTTVAKNLTNFSMAAWINRPSLGTLQAVGFIESLNNYLGIYCPGNNTFQFLNANGGTAYAQVNSNLTGFNHIAFTFNGTGSGNANRLKGYINGINQNLSFLGNPIPTTTSNSSGLENFRIGRVQATGEWSTGSFAEIGMWKTTLTAEEIASLAKGMTCDKVGSQSLVYYTPLVREIQDISLGMTLTNTNTTVATHPRVYA
jgi:hypothetical protein